MNRNEKIDRIDQSAPEVLVVGAGINGIGTFRDLALQGVEVVLVDRGDYCSGASAASSHMAHGGIRYLENGEFRLVREAVRERNRMIKNAPHLVRPLPTVIPIYKVFSGLLNAPLKFLNLLDRPSERGALVIKIGLMLYDAYTRKQGTVPPHVFRGRRDSLKKFPQLNQEIQFTATYYDGQILSPERYAVELILDGEAEGDHALAVNYLSAERLEGDVVRLKDELTGRIVQMRPRLIVNAAGPWIDRVNRHLGIAERYIGGTKGSHLVLDHPELRAAICDHEFFFENSDGRIVLVLPFFEKVIIGTSDIPIEDPDDARCTPEEEAYFFSMVRRVFPGIAVGPENVVFRFSGVRPLQYMDAKSAGQIARDHSLELDRTNEIPVYSLVGGKWTSYRAFSEQATDAVLAYLGKQRQATTRELAIGGGRGYPAEPEVREAVIHSIAEPFGLDLARAENLFNRYGTRAPDIASWISARPDQPLATRPDWSRREVEFLIDQEQAVRLEDLVLRRSTLAWLGSVDEALLSELASIFAESLGWTDEQSRSELTASAARLNDLHGLSLRFP